MKILSLERLLAFHRWHALAMSAIVLMASVSGLLHTWMSRTQSPPPAARPTATVDLAGIVIPPSVVAAALPSDAGPVVSANLRRIESTTWYQVVTADSPRPYYVDAVHGRLDPDQDVAYAASIAGQAAAGANVVNDGWLTRFDHEYIAIFRILPVYRFRVEDGRGTRFYVSTATGSITRATDDAKQWEADMFTYAHKWNFIPNRTVRDGALMLAMVGVILLAITGILLFVRTRRWTSSRP